MNRPLLIIITGMPGTGKTTLGNLLSEKYKFPLISKDALKERIFDTLGWSDKAWSLKVSAASHRIMDLLIEEELKAGHSLILESNFKVDLDSPRFQIIQSKYGCHIVQILCWAEGEIVFDRFMKRIGTPARHAGQVEAISAEQIREEFVAANGKDTPLTLPGTLIELDTTDLSSIDYSSLYRAIDALHDA